MISNDVKNEFIEMKRRFSDNFYVHILAVSIKDIEFHIIDEEIYGLQADYTKVAETLKVNEEALSGVDIREINSKPGFIIRFDYSTYNKYNAVDVFVNFICWVNSMKILNSFCLNFRLVLTDNQIIDFFKE